MKMLEVGQKVRDCITGDVVVDVLVVIGDKEQQLLDYCISVCSASDGGRKAWGRRSLLSLTG